MAVRPLPIALPCREAFDVMAGDEKTRFCAVCGKHVHDLSARTEAEARALLATARGTRICVRYARDSRGGIRFRAVTAAAVAALSVAACTSATPGPEPLGSPPANGGSTTAGAVAAPDDPVDYDMGDTIVDAIDRCPDEPGPDEDGCPEPDPPARR